MCVFTYLRTQNSVSWDFLYCVAELKKGLYIKRKDKTCLLQTV